MKIILKQLFCKHMWKTQKESFLERTRECDNPRVVPELTTWSNYKYYAVYQKCIKCDKERVERKRILII